MIVNVLKGICVLSVGVWQRSIEVVSSVLHRLLGDALDSGYNLAVQGRNALGETILGEQNGLGREVVEQTIHLAGSYFLASCFADHINSISTRPSTCQNEININNIHLFKKQHSKIK